MTYEEMSKFTYDELSTFSYVDLTLGKLELFQKTYGDNDISVEVKRKIKDLCYETINSMDPTFLEVKEISKEKKLETIKDLLVLLTFIEKMVKTGKLAMPILKNLCNHIHEILSLC